MSKLIKVGVIFGGKSGEHEVSIQSAKSVMASLNPEKYEVIPIGISKQGEWFAGRQALRALKLDPVDLLTFSTMLDDMDPPALVQEDSAVGVPGGALVPSTLVEGIDVVIPVLHGSNGEDGTMQGLLEVLDLPYVGAGVLASAVGMDKVFMKTVFAAAGLPQVNYTYFTRRQWSYDRVAILAQVEAALTYPCFVKPANLGSSVGISKVRDQAQLAAAIDIAVTFDRKVIVEQGLSVREIEVGVLGNDAPVASVPGEVIPSAEFYDYKAKYLDGESTLLIPANLTAQQNEEIRQLAVRAFQAVDCTGLARIDFFIETGTNRILVNEINTMPGFTQYSMYPKLWEATGVSYPQLIDQLIHLAIERHAEKHQNVTDYEGFL